MKKVQILFILWVGIIVIYLNNKFLKFRLIWIWSSKPQNTFKLPLRLHNLLSSNICLLHVRRGPCSNVFIGTLNLELLNEKVKQSWKLHSNWQELLHLVSPWLQLRHTWHTLRAMQSKWIVVIFPCKEGWKNLYLWPKNTAIICQSFETCVWIHASLLV